MIQIRGAEMCWDEMKYDRGVEDKVGCIPSVITFCNCKWPGPRLPIGGLSQSTYLLKNQSYSKISDDLNILSQTINEWPTLVKFLRFHPSTE